MDLETWMMKPVVEVVLDLELVVEWEISRFVAA